MITKDEDNGKFVVANIWPVCFLIQVLEYRLFI